MKTKIIQNPSENWGGTRKGAGRPSTGRKKVVLYVTEQEKEKIKELIRNLRGEK